MKKPAHESTSVGQAFSPAPPPDLRQSTPSGYRSRKVRVRPGLALSRTRGRAARNTFPTESTPARLPSPESARRAWFRLTSPKPALPYSARSPPKRSCQAATMRSKRAKMQRQSDAPRVINAACNCIQNPRQYRNGPDATNICTLHPPLHCMYVHRLIALVRIEMETPTLHVENSGHRFTSPL